MQKLLRYSRKHWVAVLMGFLLTLIITAPTAAFPFFSKDYQGINVTHFGGDGHLYLSRAREALEGHSLGNVFFRENKGNQDLFFTYSERLLFGSLYYLGLSGADVVAVNFVYNFIGVFAIILLVYSLVFQLSGDKFLALTAAMFAIGGYHLIYNKSFFYNDFNMYNRPMLPWVSSLAFFTHLNLLAKSLLSRKNVYIVLAALSFGSLFYIYYFAWSFALALNGILLFLYFFRRDWVSSRIMAVIFMSGILIGAYNFCRIAALFFSDSGRYFSYFLWSLSSHTPIFSNLGAATLVLWAAFIYKNREKLDPTPIFLLGIILAGWLAFNAQIITGRMVQVNHYYWYFIVPLSIIVSLYIIYSFLESVQRRRFFLIGVLLTVFTHVALGQYQSFFTTLEDKEYEQNYRPIIDALNANVNSGVILAPVVNHLEMLFTIYTDHDLLWTHPATYSLNSLQRFRDSLYIYATLNRDARSDFPRYLQREINDDSITSIYKEIYAWIEGFESGLDFYRYQSVINDENIIGVKRREIIKGLSVEYSVLAENNYKGIRNLLSKYGVNYIVWDKNRNPEWDLSLVGDLRIVESYNNIDLFQITY